jgi:hypothetical protein
VAAVQKWQANGLKDTDTMARTSQKNKLSKAPHCKLSKLTKENAKNKGQRDTWTVLTPSTDHLKYLTSSLLAPHQNLQMASN